MNKQGMGLMFSSTTPEWETPQALFDALDCEFSFDLDVCATEANAKCLRYFTPEMNGLIQPWWGQCWMNPPYGRQVGAWVEKARHSGEEGARVVCLLPARTDTAWFHDHVMRAQEVRLLRGRLHFGGSETGAPFPSMIVVFDGFGGPPVFWAWDWKEGVA